MAPLRLFFFLMLMEKIIKIILLNLFHYPITNNASKKLFIPTLLEKCQTYLPSLFFFLRKWKKKNPQNQPNLKQRIVT